MACLTHWHALMVVGCLAIQVTLLTFGTMKCQCMKVEIIYLLGKRCNMLIYSEE